MMISSHESEQTVVIINRNMEDSNCVMMKNSGSVAINTKKALACAVTKRYLMSKLIILLSKYILIRRLSKAVEVYTIMIENGGRPILNNQ